MKQNSTVQIQHGFITVHQKRKKSVRTAQNKAKKILLANKIVARIQTSKFALSILKRPKGLMNSIIGPFQL